MLKLNKGLVLLLINAVLVIALYAFFKPIAFFLLTGIILSITFFFITVTYFQTNSSGISSSSQTKLSTVSVIILGLLFLLSIKVLKDYQRPGGDNPYFTNADHYAIQNAGVAFDDKLELYSPDDKESSGFWKSDTGTLVVQGADNAVKISTKNFYTPIFNVIDEKTNFLFFKISKEKTNFLNPVLEKPIDDGFTISNNLTSIVWKQFSVEKSWIPSWIPFRDDNETYKMEITFTTKDTNFVGKSGRTVSSSFNIETSIKKGISLLNLLQKQERSDAFNVDGVVYSWLNLVGDISLIVKEGQNGQKDLYLQPSVDLINENYSFTLNGNIPIRKQIDLEIPLSTNFYVGLSRGRYPLKIEKKSESPFNDKINKNYILSFEEQNLIPFYHVPGIDDFYSMASEGKEGSENKSKVGSTKIRFLKNTIDFENGNKLKEGFVFQRNMKTNPETAIDGFLEFQIDKSGVPLKWRSGLDNYIEGPGNIVLNSNADKYSWIISVKDLSDNWFSFEIVRWYLLFIVITMMILILYFSSPAIIAIETPILILIYCFLVFRYLLTWRVATFPPLENIKKYELENTLRQFDNLIKDVPSSFTFLFTIFTLIVLMLYRGWSDFKQTRFGKLIESVGFLNLLSKTSGLVLKSRDSILKLLKSDRIELKFTLFIVLFSLLNIFGVDQMQRLIKIILPITGYFVFVYSSVKSNIKYTYISSNKNFISAWVIPLFSKIIETPVSYLSLVMLMYFGIFDTGFAVIFLIFTFFRFIISGILKYKNIKRVWKYREETQLIAVLISLVFLLALIFYKGSIHFILKFDNYFIAILSVLMVITFLLLKLNLTIKKTVIGFFTLVFILSLAPKSSDIIHDQIQEKVKLTKYRAELIYRPMDSVLYDNKFQSRQEAKIIETAQSQWFIHTYLKDAKFLDLFSVGDWIDFRPHFKVGVDYSTQTRDVVLPRYVIGEFGGFTMLLLLLFCALPLILYLYAYRIADRGQKNLLPDSMIGLLAVLLFFTIALMLWLTATNRFVFFGQDFPFLSITSKVSVIIPIFLLLVVLYTNPGKLMQGELSRSRRLLPGLGIFLIVLSAIIASQKSTEITDDNFKVNFSRIEKNLNDHVGPMLSQIQHNWNLPSFKNEDLSPEDRISDIKKVINRLTSDQQFKAVYDNYFSKYEQTLWDTLRSDPTLGLRLNSPIHFKIDDEKLKSEFNPYWTLELPPYNEKQVWKGDVEQEMNLTSDSVDMQITRFTGCKIVTIPSSYTLNKKPIALLETTGNEQNKYTIYNLQSRKIDSIKTGDYYRVIRNTDIVLGLNEKNEMKVFSLDEKNKKYFSRSILLNGKVQSVYPLRENLFWARHWAMATKTDFEKYKKDRLNDNTTITLDYDLTKGIGQHLKSAFRNNKDLGLKNAAFSVIAADGEGKIRVLNDFARERKLIDPNNEPDILEEQQNSYFYVDAAKERIQWGNLNLLRMREGPGSTMKPLIATAITSQVNAGWESIQYNPINNPSSVNFETGITHYGGLALNSKWKLKGNNNPIDGLKNYISQSNNFFHSLIIFLGYYTKKEFAAVGNKISGLLLPAGSSNDPLNFPIINLGSSKFQFAKLAAWPKEQRSQLNFGDNESLLNIGLGNFGLETNTDNLLNRQNAKENFSALSDTVSRNNTWAFPEYSYMLLSKRVNPKQNVENNFNSALRQTSLGSGGVIDVSPFKMAEMFGKMLLQNAGYNLKIDVPKPINNPWRPDPGWNNTYKSFLSDKIYGGMSSALTDGTAASLGIKLRKYSAYTFYAKTGTIGSADGTEKGDNSKRLAILITKGGESAASQSGKFYVVYFRFDKARKEGMGDGDFWTLCDEIIGKIVSSSSFKNYMGE